MGTYFINSTIYETVLFELYNYFNNIVPININVKCLT